MRTFILLLLMQLVSLPFSYARQPEHSTYLVAHDLKSLDYVRQIDYAQFDYIYHEGQCGYSGIISEYVVL